MTQQDAAEKDDPSALSCSKDEAQALCKSSQLLTGGEGLRFVVSAFQEKYPAFVVRHRAGISAFLNICAHMDLELDWTAGRFFDSEGHHIVCSTHGALYESVSGLCVKGPCRGARLRPVAVQESADQVFLVDSNFVLVSVEL